MNVTSHCEDLRAQALAFAQLAILLKHQNDSLTCDAAMLRQILAEAIFEDSDKPENERAKTQLRARALLDTPQASVAGMLAVLAAARKSLPVMRVLGWSNAVAHDFGDDIDRAIEAQAAQECYDELAAALEAIDQQGGV